MISLTRISPETVIEVNFTLLFQNGEPGYRAPLNLGLLESALGRIDSHIFYNGLDDLFEVAALYAEAIANAHAFSDANKRTGLVVALDFLSIHDHAIEVEYEKLANAMEDLVKKELATAQFADLLYTYWKAQKS